ncbi:MAG: hypothetical protein KDA33_01785 [Phycisphaerales bacterium]|nr:hypothetical protein [Phycisphaerales bacterium]
MNSRQSHRLVVALIATLSASATTHAVLVPAVGPGTGVGRIEHSVFALGAGGPGAVFDGFFNPAIADGGDLLTPGFNYRTLVGAPTFDHDTGALGLIANVPVGLATAPNAAAGFGGATTQMVALAGNGRAGLAATNFTLYDNNANGFSSINVFGGSVDYVNVGAPIVGGRFGHFLSATAVAPVGGYIAAGVKSIIEIDFAGGTGLGFGADAFWEPLPILVAFDGVGIGRADMIQADVGLSSFVAFGQTLSFSAAAASVPLNIPIGASIRMRSTVTLIADPEATIEIADLPMNYGNSFDFGVGGASNGAQFVPEPGSLGFLLIGGCLMQLRRQR